MGNVQKGFSVKVWISLLLLCLTGATIYYMPYLRWTYYDTLLEASGLNNTQFGFTMSIFGVTSMIFYPFGGILADRFQAKYMLFISMVGTGLLGYWYASFPGYGAQVAIFACWGVLITLTFWSAMMKATRQLGTSEQQGRLFGLLEGGRGLLTTIVGFIALFAFSKMGESLDGMKGILRAESTLCIIVGILVLIFLKENEEIEGETEKKKLSLRDIGLVLKTPSLWLITLVVICCYSVYLGSTYLTPYFTNIIGATASFAGVLAIMRTYILQFVCGPTGGILADKAKSISKVVVGCYILILASLVVIMVLPSDASTMIPMVILMILLCAAIFAMRGIYFATIDEANIPRHVTGTAIGIVSLIGFTPDVFMSPICGKLLDAYDGAAGYRAIFLLMMVFAVIGTFAAIILLKISRKKKEVENP